MSPRRGDFSSLGVERNLPCLRPSFDRLEKEGSEPIRCGNPKCNKLNPPEAKSCWGCGAELPRSTPRQLWAYSGLAIETHDSAENQYVNGQLQRSRKQTSIRGLNQNHNPDLKNLFKSASAVAAVKTGPFQKFYAALIGKGLKPEMARLTLARKSQRSP